jgi:DNA topoisomerase-3
MCGLPIHKLVKKEPCNVTGYDLEERQTKPPSRFTDGTLILTMEKAGKYIENEELRAQIRTSGIGTSATRAGINQKAGRVGYMRIQPKTQVISPTDKGEAIVALVKLTAKELLSPALTASWEKGLNQVQTGETAEAEFLDKLEAYIGRIIDKVNRQGDVNIEQALARLNQRETQTGTGAAAARP